MDQTNNQEKNQQPEFLDAEEKSQEKLPQNEMPGQAQPTNANTTNDIDQNSIDTARAALNTQDHQAANTQSINPAMPQDPKEMIDMAEDIIEKDKDDPYLEEEDHEDVQVQYLKSKFGKDIKKS